MQIPIPDDWDGQSTCRWAICWPDSVKWRAILSGLVELPNQGRFWDFSTGNFLLLRAEFKPIYDYNFELKETIMACGDNGLIDIAEAIRALAVSNSSVASSSASCSCGGQTGYTQGAITTPGGAVPIFGNQPPLSRPNDTLPPGYDDLEQARLDKCSIATALVDGMIRSLAYLQALDLFNLTALAGIIGVAMAGLSPLLVFPPAAIIVMITALGFLAGAMVLLGDVRSWAIENREWLICQLYTGESTEAIISVISDALDALIATLPTSGPIGWALKTIVLVLLNGDSLNRLMTLEGASGLPPGECADCDDVCGFDFDFRTLDDYGFAIANESNVSGTGASFGVDGVTIVTSVTGIPGILYWQNTAIEPVEIVSGARFLAYGYFGTPTTCDMYFEFDDNPGDLELIWGNGFANLGQTIDVDLSAFVGRAVVGVYVYGAWGSTGGKTFSLQYLRVSC